MSLHILTQYWPLLHTHKSISNIDAGVAVLATSFVSCRYAILLCQLCYNSFQVSHLVFRYFEPNSKLSFVALLVIPTLLSKPISYTGCSIYAALPLAFTTYIGALILFTLAYRFSPFHPLAKYPGPVIAKTSKWWAAYISAKGNSHRYYKHLHDRYGDLVRIGQCRRLPFVKYSLVLSLGPNELSIRDASLIRPVLGQGGLPEGPRACRSYLDILIGLK